MMEPVRIEKRPSRPLPNKDWALTGANGREQNIVRSLWLKEGALEELNLKLQEKLLYFTGKPLQTTNAIGHS